MPTKRARVSRRKLLQGFRRALPRQRSVALDFMVPGATGERYAHGTARGLHSVPSTAAAALGPLVESGFSASRGPHDRLWVWLSPGRGPAT